MVALRHLAGMCLAGLFLTAAPSAWAQKKAPETQLELGTTAPSFVLNTLNPQNGIKRFNLRDYVGKSAKQPQKVMLNFAASYCEPCKKELAELKALAPAMAKAGTILAIVIVDKKPEGIQAMKSLTVDKLKLPYPILTDRFGLVARRYRAQNLPTSILVNAKGTISWQNSGYAEGALAAFKKAAGIKP